MEKVTITAPIKVGKNKKESFIIEDAQGFNYRFDKKGNYDGCCLNGKTIKRKEYMFDEVLMILRTEKGRKFRGIEWSKLYSYIEIRYISAGKGRSKQPYIALVLDNGGEMVHPYIPSSHDMLGEVFIEVK